MMTDERRPITQSDRYLLVQARFDSLNLGPVDTWIADRRARGVSWAHISRDLYDQTGMEVSYETLRRWSPPAPAPTPTPAAGPEDPAEC